MGWGIDEKVTHLKKQLAFDLIETYLSFEAEVIGFQPDGSAANFLRLMIAEPANPPAYSELVFLTLVPALCI